ncbi:ribbon-helix-helix domain-containing protein [Magnetospirillum aberrantis SpK]|uniref:Ribbon-helix-helix domain-containing protein n=1 Tax=Magnetospirillum aberrantis SpK TaxID=908842 RepID=A0A7C9V0F0_9PROT|nr:ribbon-helix-helix domain-containing protein [Magnetospirillum aberrantis SpK]
MLSTVWQNLTGVAVLKKRSLVIAGHATSVSLEPQFWDALKAIAGERGLSLNQMAAEIDLDRTGNLSSALRVYVLEYLQKRTPGQIAAGGG